MSLSDLKNELIYHKLEDRYLVLPATGATVGEAAKVLQVDPDAIAKSLVLNVNEQPTVLVLSGNARLDNHHLKKNFGCVRACCLQLRCKRLRGGILSVGG